MTSVGKRPGAPVGAAPSAAAWADRGPAKRAAALVDLLLLTDALPRRRPVAGPRMPRICSGR